MYTITCKRPAWLKYASEAVMEHPTDLVLLQRDALNGKRTFALGIDWGARRFPDIVMADKPVSTIRKAVDNWIRGHRQFQEALDRGIYSVHVDGKIYGLFDISPQRYISLGITVTRMTPREQLFDMRWRLANCLIMESNLSGKYQLSARQRKILAWIKEDGTSVLEANAAIEATYA